MTDAEYQELLDALARKHLRFRTIRHRIETEEIAFLIERLSATSRLTLAAADRPDSEDLRHALTDELRRAPVNIAVGWMERAGVIDALEEGDDLIFENLRRSAIPAEDVDLLRDAGVRDPEAEITILIRYTQRHVGRHGTRPADVLASANDRIPARGGSLSESSNVEMPRPAIKRKIFSGIGKILAGTVTGLGNTLLGLGTVVAPNPATAYGVIASAAIAVGSVCQGIGDLRGE